MLVSINNHVFDVHLQPQKRDWLNVPKAVLKQFGHAVVEDLSQHISDGIMDTLQYRGTFDIGSKNSNVEEYVHFHFEATEDEKVLLMQIIK